jgi:molybdopterin converting factor small subunit
MSVKTSATTRFLIRDGKKGNLLEVRGLSPTPEERWDLLRRFLDLNPTDLEAMGATVEILMRRGPEFVAGTYEYLAAFPATASILGWEHGVDEAHLEERRRFFTIWLARTLGLDLSADMAAYLFRAGKWHAGHGPRAIHTPEIFVTGSVSLTQAAFARYLANALEDAQLIARALSGWNKVLTLHLDMMLAGYRAARVLEEGSARATLRVYNKLRPILGLNEMDVGVGPLTTAGDLLRRVVDYFPQLRDELFESHVEAPLSDQGGEVPTWLEDLEHVYVLRPSWTILHNNVNLRWREGLEAQVKPDDTLAIFPPTR